MNGTIGFDNEKYLAEQTAAAQIALETLKNIRTRRSI
jgi:hypothetical protein